MDTPDIKAILKELQDHESRISLLEDKSSIPLPIKGQQKEITLVELIKGKKFSSGQQKVAAIVGYFEKISKKNNISREDIRNDGIRAKWKVNMIINLWKE